MVRDTIVVVLLIFPVDLQACIRETFKREGSAFGETIYVEARPWDSKGKG